MSAKGIFVGVGHDGLRITSEDGLTWKNAQVGKDGQTFKAVRFGNGLCVGIGTYGGSNLFGVTKNGVDWNIQTKDAGYSAYVGSLLFAQNTFFAFGGDGGSVGASHPFETHSSDGVNWTANHEIGGKHVVRRVAYGNGLYVGVGDRGRRCVSKNGSEWTDLDDVKAINTLVDVTFGNGVFVGVGLNGLRSRTLDGVHWTDRQMGEEGEHLNSILWTDDKFVAVGMGATFISPDGKTWRRQENQNAPLVAVYGRGIYVGAHWRGRLFRSDDAVNWKEMYKCERHIVALDFGNFT